MFWFLCVFRILNVSLVESYFDPDEFWQTVEPAYCTVFQPGKTCAWTWEWTRRPASEVNYLIESSLWGPARSYVSVLPTIIFYRILQILQIESHYWISRGPMIWNAVLVAAPTDWAIAYTGVWLWGNYWALLASLISWFQAYSLIRTFANSQETMLLSVAVALVCPELFGKTAEGFQRRSSLAFLLGGLSVAIRFTSLAAFVPLGVLLALQQKTFQSKIIYLIMPCAIWGVLGLLAGLVIDRCFYGFWTLPFLGNFHFNVILDHASLYGSHPWHWYFTVGLPVVAGLLLPMILFMKTGVPGVRPVSSAPRNSTSTTTTAEVVNSEGDPVDTLKELEKLHEQLEREKQEVEERLRSLEAHRIMVQNADSRQRMAIRSLWIILLSYLAIMSLNDHKEFRYIHPVLPLVCLLSAPYIQQLVVDFGTRSIRQWAILLLVVPNLLAVLYLGLFHQSGPIHVNKAILEAALKVPNPHQTPFSIHYLTGACHSTPLYSYLHSPQVQFDTWTLDCSPSCRADPSQICEYERFDRDPEAFVDEAYQITACQMREDETCEKVDKIPDFIVTFTRYAEDLHLSSLGLHAMARFPHHLKGVQLSGWTFGNTEPQWAQYSLTSWLQLSVEEMVVYAGGKFAA
jgi:phosphatidylinositol glycan class B